jgi:uncharacterized phage protein (TIGR01671 family)
VNRIEFRGKVLFTKPGEAPEWVYGHYYEATVNSVIVVRVPHGPTQSDPGGGEYIDTIAVRNETVGQWTGLKDSDDKDIFEGDFVEFTYWWFDGAMERDSTLSGVITYEAKHMSFALRGIKNKAWLQHVGEKDSDTAMFAFFNFAEADFHVRGNIHDNPELLEEPAITDPVAKEDHGDGVGIHG